jgi:hypothetical protein
VYQAVPSLLRLSNSEVRSSIFYVETLTEWRWYKFLFITKSFGFLKALPVRHLPISIPSSFTCAM